MKPSHMRTAACILLYFCFSFSNVHAQKTVTVKKQVIYEPFKAFFDKHKQLREIRFKNEWLTDSFELEMIEDGFDSSFFNGLNRFDLDNKGDRYFFGKRFGPFAIPASLYTKWMHKKADFTSVSGQIRSDSVLFELTATYYPKKSKGNAEDEDKVFIKVETKVDYQKGRHVLAQELEKSLSSLEVLPTDSVFIARCLVEKTGCIVIDKVERGYLESPYTNALIQALNASRPWIPYEACGRKVRAYKKIYVRINPDKTYLVALQ